MAKRRNLFDISYEDPFIRGNATPKHSWRQVNGETQETQHNIITRREQKKFL